MKVSQAAAFWLNYHRANSSENTIRAYKELLERFCQKLCFLTKKQPKVDQLRFHMVKKR